MISVMTGDSGTGSRFSAEPVIPARSRMVCWSAKRRP
jgi:hypothetical protein